MKDSARYVLNGLAHAGVGEVLFDTFAVGFVRQRLAGLRQIGLAIGIVNVRQEFRTLAQQRTAAVEQVAGRAHQGYPYASGSSPPRRSTAIL
jgi:hypothetical protein